MTGNQTGSSSVRRKQRSMLCFFCVLFLPAALIVGLIAWIFYSTAVQSELQLLKAHDSDLVELQKEVTASNFKLVASDLMYFAQQSELLEALNEDDPGEWMHLAQDYFLFVVSKKIYDQVRFIDANGMERVRVNYNDGKPNIVADDELQQKGGRYYFQDTFRLARDEIFVSPFDLNIEHGKVEQPPKPMIRFGTPVFDYEGNKRGIIIFNYLGSNLIDHFIRTHVRNPNRSHLLNADGYWLHDSKSEVEWSFMFPERKQQSFLLSFPQEWQRITAADTGQFQTGNGLFTFTTIHPLQESWKSSDGAFEPFMPSSQRIEGREYQWKIVSHIPQAEMLANSWRFAVNTLQLSSLVILLLGIGSWLLTKAIMKRKQAEYSLHKSEERYRGIFDESVATIYVFDQEKNFIDSNQAGLGLLGYSREELFNMSITDVDADHGAVLPAHKHLLSGGSIVNFEHRLVHKDGHIITVLNNSRPLLNSEGEVMGMQSTLVDITEQKKLEEQLLQSQKMEAIGTLVGGIAHDFNNTLAAIQGNLYLAKNKMDEKDTLAIKLGNIEKLSNRAAEMVQQLLTFARKDIVSTRPFSLTSFMNEEFKLTRNIIPENIDYSMNLCDEELIIHGDATQLQQVVINLLNNARDAVRNSNKPKIVCTLESFSVNADFQQRHPEIKGERVAHLMVEDNGCGISEDALAQIFVPFFTTKGVGEGTGLGLAMVYGSIQTHGGAIEVDSREGEGTAFHVYLPLSKDDEEAIDEPEENTIPGEGETILLADDETEMRKATGEVLSSLGYRVLLAADGEEAVELFKANADDVSLVISDLVMPKMGGVDAVKQMRLLNSELPVIFATGYDKDQSATSGEEIKRSITISKPFSFGALSQSIRRMVDPN